MKAAALAIVTFALTAAPPVRAEDKAAFNQDYAPNYYDAADKDRTWWGYAEQFGHFDEDKLAESPYWTGNGDVYPEGNAYHNPGWQSMGVQCYKEYSFCTSEKGNNRGQGHGRLGGALYCNCLSADCAPKVDKHFDADADGKKCSDLVPKLDPAHQYFAGEKSELMGKIKGVLVVPGVNASARLSAEVLVGIVDWFALPGDAEAIHTLYVECNKRFSPGKGPYSKVLDVSDLDLDVSRSNTTINERVHHRPY